MRTERQVPYCLKWLIGISEVLIEGGTRGAGLYPSQQEFFLYLSSLLSGVRQGTCQKYFFFKNPPSCPTFLPVYFPCSPSLTSRAHKETHP